MKIMSAIEMKDSLHPAPARVIISCQARDYLAGCELGVEVGSRSVSK